MSQRKGLTITDVLITVVIGLVFAVIYSITGTLRSAVEPLGLHLNELIYGMYFIAAIVAYLIIRKPGVALIAEFAAGAGETIIFLQFDTVYIVYALFQGLACELIFALTKYKSVSMMTAIIAGFAAGVASIPVAWHYSYLAHVEGWNLALIITFRLISGILIAGVLGHLIFQALKKTGVLKLVGRRYNTEEL